MSQYNMLTESVAFDSSRTLQCDCGARAAAIGTHCWSLSRLRKRRAPLRDPEVARDAAF
ncbi:MULTISPECIES: hypothetical protein [Burkholderia]|uniref:hypothetical protein n=1 Tax=Burkholderia TaxID=32008 RepID=UPI00158C532C|nr:MULTISPECIES: hypothetical protein [Burkholderia]MDN7682799.1 hypothetical protein [Burkholderia cenocepacia]